MAGRITTVLIAAAAALGGAGAMAAWQARLPAATGGVTGQQAKAYLLAHPELIEETLGTLHDQQAARIIAANRDSILKPFGSAWAGNPHGDVTVVEYFDYACGYCRASLPIIARLIASDPGVKVVYRDWPILSEESLTAAELSLVAAERGRFAAFHDALYGGGPISDATMTRALAAAGLNPADARAAARAPHIREAIRANHRVAQQLALTGTPSWVIGNQVISSALPFDALQRAVAAARAEARKPGRS